MNISERYYNLRDGTTVNRDFYDPSLFTSEIVEELEVTYDTDANGMPTVYKNVVWSSKNPKVRK